MDPFGQRLYRPIESFGKLYLQADSWHTDATGYEPPATFWTLIARAVFDALTRDEGLRTRLQEKTQR
jgi:hypothetical protein